MFNLGQQQPQEHFPFLSELESRVHPLTKWCLAGMGVVGGYFWGIGQTRMPVVLFMALGLVGGLLFVGILKHLTGFVIGCAIVISIAAATFFLLQNDNTLKGNAGIPPRITVSARPSWLDILTNEVKP